MSDAKPPKPPPGGDAGDDDLPLISDWKPGRRADPLPAAPAPPVSGPDKATEAKPPEASLATAKPAGPAAAKADRPAKLCPKCGWKNRSFVSCDRCGLVFANWRPELAEREYAAVPPEAVARARALWEAIAVAPDRLAALHAFHDFCIQNRAAAYAAVRYRAWLAQHPEDAAVLLLKEKLVSQAAVMLPEKPAKKEKKSIGPRGLAIAVALFVLLTGLSAWLFTLFFDSYR